MLTLIQTDRQTDRVTYRDTPCLKMLLPLYWHMNPFSEYTFSSFHPPGVSKLKATWFWFSSLGWPGAQELYLHLVPSLHCHSPVDTFWWPPIHTYFDVIVVRKVLVKRSHAEARSPSFPYGAAD